MTAYKFVRHGRSTKTIAILIAIYVVLLAMFLVLQAAWWIVGLLVLATLPALWDVIANTSSGLVLDGDCIRWHSGRRSAEIALKDIDFFRFDTRWDFAVRVSAILTNGRRIRLPDESVPSHQVFEKVLIEAGFRVERHHFSVF